MLFKFYLGPMGILHWKNSTERFVNCLRMPEDWRHRNLMESSLCLGTLRVAVFWLIASRSNFDPPSSKSLIPKQFQGCLGHQQVPWGSLLSRVGASNLDLAELPDGADDGEDVVLVVVEPHHRAPHPRLGEGGAAALREEGEVSFIQNSLVIFVRERITNTCDVNLNPAYFSWEDPVDWLLETWPWPSHPRWEIWQWGFFLCNNWNVYLIYCVFICK